ncbi:MAG: holo-ACP synthase [Planctomycetota bacterium]
MSSIFSVGTEIVETVRIAKMIETHGEQFLERVYTPDEIEYCVQSADAPQHFATRWAAKEATMKALRCRRRGVRWNEIEIVVRPGGHEVVLSGNASQCAADRDIEQLHLSLSACRTHAVAHVVAEGS